MNVVFHHTISNLQKVLLGLGFVLVICRFGTSYTTVWAMPDVLFLVVFGSFFVPWIEIDSAGVFMV